MTWVLAIATPFALLREFGRRFAFAHLGMAEAFVIDAAVAVLQLAGLGVLGWAGALTAGTAFAAVGVACALTAGVWLYWSRDEFALRGGQWRGTMRQSWTLGKWIFASQVTLSVQAYFIHWLLAWTVGPEATGVYAACMTIALFSNPLILGISNALAPRTAHAFTSGGGGRVAAGRVPDHGPAGRRDGRLLRRRVRRRRRPDGIPLPRQQYGGQDHTVAVLALAMLATALGMPASNGLTAVERPDVVFKVGLVAVGAVRRPGPVPGRLVGDHRGGLRVPRRQRRRGARPVGGVLRPGHEAGLAGARHRRHPRASAGRPRHGRGRVGDRAAQRRRPGEHLHRPRPAEYDAGRTTRTWWSSCSSRPPGERVEEVRDQFQSMARFHAKLDGSTANGWRMYAPVPLHQCDRPFALVMTRVPGVPLNECVVDGRRLTPDALAAIADAVVAGMERTWAVESQIHGDFNFDNILCDLPTRTLSFVDPGVREDVPSFDGFPAGGTRRPATWPTCSSRPRLG